MSATSPNCQDEGSLDTGHHSPSVVSRLVNFVAKSSPIRFSTSNPNLAAEPVSLDEDISLPTHKTLATLSVVREKEREREGEGERERERHGDTSGDTIYYSLSDSQADMGRIAMAPIAVYTASLSPPAADSDIKMGEESFHAATLGGSAESVLALASSSALQLHEFGHCLDDRQHGGGAGFDAAQAPQGSVQPGLDDVRSAQRNAPPAKDVSQAAAPEDKVHLYPHRREADQHAEFLQFEIQTLQEKYNSSLQSNQEMRAVLLEYERTMAQIIDARSRGNSDPLLQGPDHLIAEKKQLEADIQTMQISFHNLHQRYDDLKHLYEQAKMHEQNMKHTLSAMQADLSTADRRYEALRKHAEDKLDMAAKEIAGLKDRYEDDLSLAKAKLVKAEIRVNTLENTVAAKASENTELMKICDELMQKIDRK